MPPLETTWGEHSSSADAYSLPNSPNSDLPVTVKPAFSLFNHNALKMGGQVNSERSVIVRTSPPGVSYLDKEFSPHQAEQEINKDENQVPYSRQQRATFDWLDCFTTCMCNMDMLGGGTSEDKEKHNGNEHRNASYINTSGGDNTIGVTADRYTERRSPERNVVGRAINASAIRKKVAVATKQHTVYPIAKYPGGRLNSPYLVEKRRKSLKLFSTFTPVQAESE